MIPLSTPALCDTVYPCVGAVGGAQVLMHCVTSTSLTEPPPQPGILDFFCLFVFVFILFCFVVLFLETEFSFSVYPWMSWNLILKVQDQAGLELTEIHLPLPPDCWDKRRAPLLARLLF